jgi:pullulanase/glycogen debranching enzyme
MLLMQDFPCMNNQDGIDENLSWNYGAEGLTDDT